MPDVGEVHLVPCEDFLLLQVLLDGFAGLGGEVHQQLLVDDGSVGDLFTLFLLVAVEHQLYILNEIEGNSA